MTAFHSDLQTWHDIQLLIKITFDTYPKVLTHTVLKDITVDSEREDILDFTHKRADRNAKNNKRNNGNMLVAYVKN